MVFMKRPLWVKGIRLSCNVSRDDEQRTEKERVMTWIVVMDDGGLPKREGKIRMMYG